MKKRLRKKLLGIRKVNISKAMQSFAIGEVNSMLDLWAYETKAFLGHSGEAVGVVGAVLPCAGPKGHEGKHDYLWPIYHGEEYCGEPVAMVTNGACGVTRTRLDSLAVR